jgi:hypothetical protein
MRRIISKGAVAALISVAMLQPAQACWTSAGQDAAKITHLNTMLMVTALRCRGGSDNFLAHYNRFVVNNSSLIGAQAKAIKAHFSKTHGPKGSEGAFDRMAIGFANSYGTGHKNLDCGKLKALAADLASQGHGVASLVQAADQIVGDTHLPGGVCPSRLATRP